MSRKLRILLADDSRFFRAIESQFLQKNPVDILEADSCESALELIGKERPDLVYMAFSLPGEGGDLCCQRLKSSPEFSSLPVVIVCDQGAPEQPEIARRRGCNGTLVKPLDRHTFLQVGRQFLEGIREHRQPSFFPLALTVNGQLFKGKCLDISAGGMFVESQADIPSGSLITLNFKLPNDVATEITCEAEVSWLNRKPNPMKPHYPHGLGVMFIELPPSVRKSILRLTEKK